MKDKEQTRKLAIGCSKHRFGVVDKTDEVSSKHGFEVVDEATLTWFEEMFEESQSTGLSLLIGGSKSIRGTRQGKADGAPSLLLVY
ncbi:hypothetical protein WKI23_08585 [Streptococcus pneumoniae]|uniref:hypothetical protein n=1 Tax=Streptococcus pseudopneumoniae TaxID=257758 RepID=UPI0031211649